jgi:hypothetical protein
VKPFANKIFNIDEGKPRVAVAIVHPLLGFQNQLSADFTMSGAKKILDAYGFECTDLVLRKLDRGGRLTDPIALSYDESRFEQIEDEIAELDRTIPKLKKQLVAGKSLYQYWRESTLAKLNEKYVYFFREDRAQGVILRSDIEKLKKTGLRYELIDVDEEDRKNQTRGYERAQSRLEYMENERTSLTDEKKGLRADNIGEQRRITDVEAKMHKLLANIDLLVIPRITLINATQQKNPGIPNQIHSLDQAQLKAIKWYLKQGKPILFLLGPTNEPDEPPPGAQESTDQLETMLAELGFGLPKQTILYDIESREYNEHKIGIFSERETAVPGLDFEEFAPTVPAGKLKESFDPHPIRVSLKALSRATGNKEVHEVRIRHPRPVYHLRTELPAEAATSLVGSLAVPGFVGPLQATTVWLHKARRKAEENAVFLSTRKESWNEEKPFIVDDEPPIYTPTKDGDPRKGTVEEERNGPFSIGVAVETELPASWFDKAPAKPQKVRIAVVGNGGVFIGKTLPPLKEKIFLDVANWLIGRDDLLAKDTETWHYPRVELTPIEFNLWQWGARLGLPLVFIYLGTIVWMVRRMR